MSIVFKWGSLVGISLPSTGANGSLPFVAGDVEFRPREFTGAITNDWTSVPHCTTDFAPYGDKNADHLSRAHTPANIALGIGDICRHMGVIDGARWRMPTIAEWQELYGSTETNKGQSFILGNGWIAGKYFPLSGRAFGAGCNYVSITGEGAKARVTNANPHVNGAVFLPASGCRHYSTGTIHNMGIEGDSWSSTASTPTYGHYMQFTSSNVYPQYSASRPWAYPIRCIRE